MTREEKQLLLNDLCARLPYGVIIHRDDYFDPNYPRPNKVLTINSLAQYAEEIERWNIKPYLRPMSNMTDDERKEYNDIVKNTIDFYDCPKSEEICFFIMPIEWLNKHHFDYRGLISMGLALEAPADMYK